MRKFRSTMGDVYIGEVIHVYDSGYVLMRNYSCWYYDDTLPFESENYDDSVQFLMEAELPLD